MRRFQSRLSYYAALAWLCVVFAQCAQAVTFRWSAASNRIYVEGGGYATLTDIKAALTNAPLDLVDAANKKWLLRADLQVQDGCVLVLHGASAGGDVNELRLQSVNSVTPCACVVSLTTDWGALDIHSTKITSWDTAIGAPDTNYLANGRAYIRVRSSLSTNGVTALESRMDITNSEICFLGTTNSDAYGLVWKVGGTNNNIFNLVNVYGNVVNSRLHDNYLGAYTSGAYGMQFLNNEISSNADYGLSLHDDSDNLLVQGNNVHHNGDDGIFASMRCDHLTLRGNTCRANAQNGILLHRNSNNGWIEGNQCFDNGESGIAITASFQTTVRSNQVVRNAEAGIRLDLGSADNLFVGNQCISNSLYGFYFYRGSATPEPGDDGRPKRNQFVANRVEDSGVEGIRLSDSDNNSFATNSFAANGTKLRLQRGLGNVLDCNVIPADVAVRTEGDVGTNASTIVRNQNYLKVELGTNATTLVQDSQGRICEPEESSLPSEISSSGSTLTLTPAGIGSSTTVIARDFWASASPGMASLSQLIWDPSARTEWNVTPGASGQNLSFTLGDCTPNTSYQVLKANAPFATVNADASGFVRFNDVAASTSAVEYAVELRDTNAASISYSAALNRIYVAGGGQATLSDIQAELQGPQLQLVNPTNKIWLLTADLIVRDGSKLVIHGDTAGGDANELRMLSQNTGASNSVVSVTADWGTLDIDGTKITSWDSATNGPDMNYAAFGRAYIRARSSLSTNGVPLESRMDIRNSEIAYLGSDSSEGYGLVWKVSGSVSNLFNQVNVRGDVVQSRIHHNFIGAYTVGAQGMQWRTNEIYQNIQHGLDFESDSDQLVVQGNNIHDNGMNGLLADGRCDHLNVTGNTCRGNLQNGILLDENSNDSTLADNLCTDNGDSGIAVSASLRNAIFGNQLLRNSRSGLRLSLGSADNSIESNVCASNSMYGVNFYIGSGTPLPGDDGRPKRNALAGNIFHDNGVEPVRISDSDDNTFAGNAFTDAAGKLRFQRARSNWLDANEIPNAMIVRTEGETSAPASTFVRNSPFLRVELGTNSSTVFQDLNGQVFQPEEDPIPTIIEPGGSMLTLTPGDIGASSSVQARNFFADVTSGQAQIHHIKWTNSTYRAWTLNAGFQGQTLYFTLGDLATNCVFLVRKAGVAFSVVQCDATGTVRFNDSQTVTNSVVYSLEVPDPNAVGFIRIQRASTNGVTLYWPATSPSWSLQQADDLAAPNWVNLSGGTLIGAEYQLTLTNLGARAYFRLKH